MSRDGVALEPIRAIRPGSGSAALRRDVGDNGRRHWQLPLRLWLRDKRPSHGAGPARQRRYQMAQSLIAAASADGAVLVAGAGHVRSDYGIPIYLKAKAPGRQVVSIAFVEVDERNCRSRRTLSCQTLRDGAPVDYLWFTPRVDDGDSCEKFKAQFEKIKRTP